MNVSTWIPFLLMCLAVELTPGPNMAYLAILTLSSGRRAGWCAVAGIALGLALLGTMAAFGVALIITDSPILSHLLVGAGFLYLLWLAYESWQEKPLPIEAAPASHAHWQYFLRGLMTNLLNPKAFLFYVVMLPGFVGTPAHPILATLILTGMSVLVATTIHCSIVLLASQFESYLSAPSRRRRIRHILALSLVGVAVWFAVTNASVLP